MGLQLRLRAGIQADRLRFAILGVSLDCDVPHGNEDRESPREGVCFPLGSRDVLLCYGRPAARGRRIFGDVVPLDALWRLGANEPTCLHLPFPATVAGVRLDRGVYSLYALPGEREWRLIINRSIRQSGRTREETGKRGNVFPNAYTTAVERAEVGRVPVETRTVQHTDRLTATADVISHTETHILFTWEERQLVIPIVSR